MAKKSPAEERAEAEISRLRTLRESGQTISTNSLLETADKVLKLAKRTSRKNRKFLEQTEISGPENKG